MRFFVPIEKNDDFFVYSQLFNYDFEFSLEFILGEPYIKILYSFFALFFDEKMMVLKSIYFFNFFVSNIFFIWLATRKNISIFSKIFFFSMYYFFFSYILLRNSLVFFAYAVLIITNFKKIRLLLFSFFSHITALLPLVLVYIKNFSLFKLILLFLIFFSSIYLFIPLNLAEEIELISKFSVYLTGLEKISLGHYIFLIFNSLFLIGTMMIFKFGNELKFIVFLFIIYILAFLVNPVIASRISPFLITTILFINYEKPRYSFTTKSYTLLLFPTIIISMLLNIYTFYDVHEF